MTEAVIPPGELSAKFKRRLVSDHEVTVHGRSGRLFFQHGANLYRALLTPDTEAGFALRAGVKPLSVDDVLWDALDEPAKQLHARVTDPLAVCFLDQTISPVTYPATESGLAAASAQVGELVSTFGEVDTDPGFIERAQATYRAPFKAAQFDLGMVLGLATRPRPPADRSNFIEGQIARAWAKQLSEFLGVEVRHKSNFVCFVVGANFFQATIGVGREIPTFGLGCSVKPYSIDDTLWELIGPYLNSDTMPGSLTWRADGAFTVSGLATRRDTHHVSGGGPSAATQMPPVRAGLTQATDQVAAVVNDFAHARDDQSFMQIAAEKYPATWEFKSTQTLGLLLMYRTGQFARLRATIADLRRRNHTGAFSFSDASGHSTSFYDVLSKAVAASDLTR